MRIVCSVTADGVSSPPLVIQSDPVNTSSELQSDIDLPDLALDALVL